MENVLLNSAYAAIAALGALLLFMILKVAYDHRGYAKAQHRFLNLLAGLGAPGEGGTRILQYQRHFITAEYHEGSRNEPRRFTLSAGAAGQGAFSITHEGTADALLERAGLAGDVETTDHQFDSSFHVVSDQMEFSKAYLASPKKREAVKRLFAEGCSEVKLDGGGLHAEWPNFEAQKHDGVGFIDRCLGPLAALTEELPPARPPQAAPGLDQATFNRYYWRAFLALAPVLFLLHRLSPLYSGQLFRNSLDHSLPVLILSLFAVGGAIKGKSWFTSAFVKTALFSLVFFPLAGFVTTAAVNEYLDKSPPAVHATPVLSKSITESRNSRLYYITVKSWHDNSGVELKVSGDTYRQVQPGRTTAEIRTKPGYLGYEYIAGFKFGTPAAQNSSGTGGSPALPGKEPAGDLKYADAYLTSGNSYLQKGEYDKAIADVSKAIELNPKLAYAYVVRATAYNKKGEYRSEIADLSTLLEIGGKSATTYAVRGSAYGKVREFNKAIEDYSKAIELDPDDAGAYFLRGFAYREKGEPEKAAADEERYRELSKK